ncbi:SagB family peptide dehydrogenase [Streptomyces sp. NBC_01216]|uniref:SagB family peptide dehydrogenase n=1 Tax=unclassified Streptomyces TaxID=2593676 RepID=UPI002E156E16|nr:SagB family peptide dehydrogenase [Streptomyces sp. NBC_01216]
MKSSAPPAPRDTRLIELWSLREDTTVETATDDPGTGLISTRWGEIRLPMTDPVIPRALERMTYGPVSLDNVLPGFSDTRSLPGDPRRAALRSTLEAVRHSVIRTLALADGTEQLSVVPIVREARFAPRPPAPDRVHRLSRFAALRVGPRDMVLESPLSAHRVLLHTPQAMWLVSCYVRPASVRDTARLLDVPLDVARTAVGYLEASGMLVPALRAESSRKGPTSGTRPRSGGPTGVPGADPGPATGTGLPSGPGSFALYGPWGLGRYAPAFAEDHDPVLEHWSPRELMLHNRSRPGLHDEPIGLGLGSAEAPKDAREHPDSDATPLALPVPDLELVLTRDPQLTTVLESRRSVRQDGGLPLSLAQLGELLYRAARARPAAGRPYPSAGSVYPLELYVTVAGSAELARGCYHYDPAAHTLFPLRTEPVLVDALLDEAGVNAGLSEEPPVLISMTARFRRMSSAFPGIAYSVLLKEVGALQQTLYLVSTAMGIGPCALAFGDTATSARAFRLDWRAESGVGEFVLAAVPTGAVSAESGGPATRRP